jgi:predicted transcriptional regulator
MNQHNVLIRHYQDGSIGIHARKDVGENRVDIHESWAKAAPDVMSKTYQKIRAGELTKVETVIQNLSKAEAQSAKRYLIMYFQNQGKSVVNPES